MSDPFANLLSAFKNGDGDAKKDAKVPASSSAVQPGKTEGIGMPVSSLSGGMSSPEIHDDFDELFGSSGSPAGAIEQRIAEDEFDAAFKAFDRDVEDEQPHTDEPEIVVDEVRDMEVAKLMSLDLSIEQATSYYDQGVMYEELVRRRRELKTSKAWESPARPAVRAEESSGFFSVASGLLEKGRQLVDQFTTYPQEQDRLSARPRQSGGASPVRRGEANDELPAQFSQSLILEEPLPAKQIHQPALSPPPETTLLDFDSEQAVAAGAASSVTPVSISHLELSGYNEFKDRATAFYRAGDYVSACEEYEKSLNSLPKDHALRIVAHSNLVASLLKNGEYKKCLSDTEIALKLFPENSELWIQNIPSTEPSKTFKEMWAKLVARRAEAFEHVEKYQEALKSYQMLIEKGYSNDKIMEGKRRCQKVLNPSKAKPAPQPRAQVRLNERPSETVSASPKTYASVQRVKEDNRKEEALEAQKAALYDTIFDQIENWKGTKGDDIRHLLANLSQVLTWCDWKPVSASELVMPKKVKVTYMKAVAKTHPDKLPASLELEGRMLAENVFSTLSVAWERFKSENDMN